MVRHRPPIDTVTHGYYCVVPIYIDRNDAIPCCWKTLRARSSQTAECRIDDIHGGETLAANSQSVCEGRYRNGIGQSAELLPKGLRSESVARAADASSTVGFQRLNGCGSISIIESRIGLRYSLLPIERWSSLVARGAATQDGSVRKCQTRCRWYKEIGRASCRERV